MLGAVDDVVLDRLRELDEHGAVARHAHDEVLVPLGMGLRIEQRGAQLSGERGAQGGGAFGSYRFAGFNDFDAFICNDATGDDAGLVRDAGLEVM
nr:hypothetical protein [uncultured Parolsenella sp.]